MVPNQNFRNGETYFAILGIWHITLIIVVGNDFIDRLIVILIDFSKYKKPEHTWFFVEIKRLHRGIWYVAIAHCTL